MIFIVKVWQSYRSVEKVKRGGIEKSKDAPCIFSDLRRQLAARKSYLIAHEKALTKLIQQGLLGINRLGQKTYII